MRTSPSRRSGRHAAPGAGVPKILLTGNPGCGKTTALRRVVESLSGRLPMTGFLTEELREKGRRVGFQGVTLDGRTFLLAHVDAPGSLRVGPYGVVLDGLEKVGIPAITPAASRPLVVLDEVGKMESFSERFRDAVEGLLAGTAPLLATVAARGVGFVKRVRQDPRVTLVRMGRDSRNAVVGDLLRRLAAGWSERAGRADRPSEAWEAVARTASDVRHRINNSLMAVLGMVELIRTREDLDESVRRKLDLIAQEAVRIRDAAGLLAPICGDERP